MAQEGGAVSHAGDHPRQHVLRFRPTLQSVHHPGDALTDTDAITRLLQRLSAGESAAEAALLPLVYAELRAVAARYLRSERAGHTLSPTALVHEAYLRLADDASLAPRDTAPCTNCAANLAMISGFFLPMALRRLSASLSVKPASALEISITCSW